LSPLVTILTSAAVGVIVSGLITLLGQRLERRARQKELVFSKALDIAIQRNEFVLKAAVASRSNATLQDSVIIAETYYRWLIHLWEHGNLPEEAKKKE
jgi:hypothetical protein